MVYQPKVNLHTGEVIGLEALVRWQSPKMGLIYPGQFIPFTERSILIHKVTFAVIEMALDQLVIWRQSKQWHIPISINVSARVLDDADFPSRLMNELDKRNLQPSDLILEITETALASSSELAKQVIGQFIAAGVGISIDDFGAGFTSFKYIRDISISEIKIDRLFIKDISREERDVSIVRSIASLSDGMGVRIVAEGIDSKQIQMLLTTIGCMYGQGFHIAPPMQADKLIYWMEKVI